MIKHFNAIWTVSALWTPSIHVQAKRLGAIGQAAQLHGGKAS